MNQKTKKDLKDCEEGLDRIRRRIDGNNERLYNLNKEIMDFLESTAEKESIAYLQGIKAANAFNKKCGNKIDNCLPIAIKYENIRLSNSHLKYDIPLKELKRISEYM